jgi:hypothetical protein
MIKIIFTAFFTVLVMALAAPAMALSTFQTYISGATAGSYGPDQDTWWYNNISGSFNLYVVGAYGPNTTSLTGVTLLISVPDSETGTIYFSTSDEAPILLTTAGASSSPETNPTTNADISVLTDVSGTSGYSTIISPTFMPDGFNANNHYPLKDNISDFLIFDLGNFTNTEGPLNNYDASTGTISPTGAYGEQKEYTISYTGFSSLHFDVYGLEIDLLGQKKITTSWEFNPGSHDATVVPEPATYALIASGALLLIVYRRRFFSHVKLDR